MTGLSERLGSAKPVAIAREALAGVVAEAWIVGGSVRDALLERSLRDIDLAISGEPEAAARALAKAARGTTFQLAREPSTWRVLPRGRRWHADISALRGESIEADLGERDFSVNAIAVPLAGGDVLDPHGGRADLEAGVLRAVSDRSFSGDPLRLLRAARIGAELGIEPEPGTIELARAAAPRAAEPAGERQFAELRSIVCGPAPLRGFELLDRLGATAVVLPELTALRGLEQNRFHDLDAHDHTLAVLERAIELEADPGAVFGERGGDVAAALAEPLADELTRAEALRFAALFHDMGKPATRTHAGDRVMFLGHDRVGADICREICTRLRTSRALAEHLALLTLNHLRLGFLVHKRPLPRRVVFEYLSATHPAPADAALLTVADRLATRGPGTSEEAIAKHLELAGELIGECLAWQASGPPAPPIDGDALASALGLRPGPDLGRLLEELRAAAFAGEIDSRDEAIELAKSLA